MKRHLAITAALALIMTNAASAQEAITRNVTREEVRAELEKAYAENPSSLGSLNGMAGQDQFAGNAKRIEPRATDTAKANAVQRSKNAS
ncbi:protein of unknown function [Noviherbaspirillum humi]|uniref:DUF4148 domain-containing protein n=1 Tax=Noviherbaspirillum humi TaxID=1688639 RepID=A0A239DE15_9BURK|nr:DUF4148 domain-containing protein [Noviherbaspirillum humi]SNS30084.1 protein of unknown function [Noviherbaspirillum humi]